MMVDSNTFNGLINAWTHALAAAVAARGVAEAKLLADGGVAGRCTAEACDLMALAFNEALVGVVDYSLGGVWDWLRGGEVTRRAEELASHTLEYLDSVAQEAQEAPLADAWADVHRAVRDAREAARAAVAAQF
jgi:hypothetical protein